MNKIYMVFIWIFLLQLSVNAQLEFGDNDIHTKASSENHNIDIYKSFNSSDLDSIITQYVASENIPGATGFIFKKDGEIIWRGNFGYRNIENQLPVEDSTLFLMASVSKTFAATAIMQLWENGMINLDESINNYLPSGFTVVNPYHPDDTITVKMLMLHTSSLRDNWGILWPLWGCGDYPETVDSFLINYFTPGGLHYSSANFYSYAPGTTWNYSNSGSCLLSLIVKNIAGKNFSEYVKDSIFTPLSMNSSSWFLEGMDTSKIATPYTGNIPQPLCHIGMAFWPIGQLRTNISELYNFAFAYLNGGVYNNQRILDSTTIAYILSYHGVSTPWGTQGLIWGKDSDVYNNIWGHSGMFVGTETGMYVCIDEDWGILFFINKGTDPYYSPGFFPVLHQLAIYAHNITDVREGINKPIEFSLNQNFPNPFNPATTIIYQLPYFSNITLKIFNTLGEEIETLVNEYKTAGRYQTEFNATNLPSGVYFYQLRAGSFVQTKKMLLLK
jgi:CubicO group peptidase (beta-lactamase class C family)